MIRETIEGGMNLDCESFYKTISFFKNSFRSFQIECPYMMGASFIDELLDKLGMNDEDSRTEAKELWSMLDNLSNSDPSAYTAYMKEQARSMQEMLQRSDHNKYITPVKGFAVKVWLTKQTTSSIRIHSDCLFMNFCKHRSVRMPHDSKGIDVSTISETIHVPLYISALRDTEDEHGNLAYVLDIISNPWCFEKSADATFMKSFVQLGIVSVEEEHQLSLTETWEQLSCSYYNRRDGQQLEEVAPFSIMMTDHRSTVSKIMNEPHTFVKTIPEKNDMDLQLMNTSKTRRDGKILIEEIESSGI